MTAAERRWTCDDVTPGDRFAWWREVVCAAFVPLRPEPIGPGLASFRGRVEQRTVGRVSVSEIAASPQEVDRARAAEGAEVWFANVQVTGRSHAQQAGRRQRLSPGDAVLLDASRPFTMRFDEPFTQRCFTLPAAALGSRSGELRALRIPAATGLATLLDGILDADLTSQPSLDVVAGDLLVRAITETAHAIAAAGSDPRLARRHAAVTAVERRAQEADLRPSDIADDLGVSVRTLQADLSSAGTTFSRRLRSARLRRASALLTSDPDVAISDVAARSGFADLSAFNRAFRRRFGTTPTGWRELRADPDGAARSP